MSACEKKTFLSVPPLKRLAVLVALAAVAIAAASVYRRSLRPKTVPPDVAAKGLAEARRVVDLVRRSEFGRGERGRALSVQAASFLEGGRLMFSTELRTEALYRKEPGAAPVLYIGVFGCPRGFVLPGRGELAERIYHEALHAVKRADRKTYEEECDAYCAAEEARSAVEGRSPSFPVERDGEVLWLWVTSTYVHARSDPEYAPVGQTLRELARKAGIEYADNVGRTPETDAGR